jgi:hypothetical protein
VYVIILRWPLAFLYSNQRRSNSIDFLLSHGSYTLYRSSMSSLVNPTWSTLDMKHRRYLDSIRINTLTSNLLCLHLEYSSRMCIDISCYRTSIDFNNEHNRRQLFSTSNDKWIEREHSIDVSLWLDWISKESFEMCITRCSQQSRSTPFDWSNTQRKKDNWFSKSRVTCHRMQHVYYLLSVDKQKKYANLIVEIER